MHNNDPKPVSSNTSQLLEITFRIYSHECTRPIPNNPEQSRTIPSSVELWQTVAIDQNITTQLTSTIEGK